MKFNIKEITLQELISLYYDDKLILDPPYQRNFIWTKADQEKLVDSLVKNYPLPNIFLFKKDEKFEVVDGQQRIRTILNYNKGILVPKLLEQRKDNIDYHQFLSYKIIVAEIYDLNEETESIEEFYSRVNKTGMKLNKPELNKAEYFYTEFLALNQELANCEQFRELDIFTEAVSKRMNDIDFISELVGLLHYGLYDKKEKVDELYEKDITPDLKDSLKSRFLEILDYFIAFNSILQIKKTRYKQRNDFFTLFGFINEMKDKISLNNFKYIYELLITVQDDISPSNDFCVPFREYALNCVSQSNSKIARAKRFQFLCDLFLNKTNQPNTQQKEIMNYYEIDNYMLYKLNEYYSLPLNEIKSIK